MSYDKIYALKNLNSKCAEAVDKLHVQYHASKDKEERKSLQKQMNLIYQRFHQVRANIMGLRRREDDL